MKKSIFFIIIALSVVSCGSLKKVILHKTYVCNDKYRKTTLTFNNDSVLTVNAEFSCPHYDNYPTCYNVICSYTRVRDKLLYIDGKSIMCKIIKIKNIEERTPYNAILWQEMNTARRIGPRYSIEHDKQCLFPSIEEEELLVIDNQIIWVKNLESGSFGLFFDGQ